MTDADHTRTLVRDHYARIARGQTAGCCAREPKQPDGDLGLGCGNPTALAALRPGETAVDLGAGGGYDCFLAARAVGPTGRVIGVDMTPDMVSLARANARKLAVGNVEFRLGEIEHLPVADASADVVLSNCVVNLSPDKPAAFADAFRVLRPGGRLAITDIVAVAPIPDEVRREAGAICGCIAGAAPLEDVKAMLAAAGFTAVTIEVAPGSAELVESWIPGASAYIASVAIEARRGEAACCGADCCP